MDLMSRRRALLARVESGETDTSPRIVEYGTYWGRQNDVKLQDQSWCITKWYDFDPEYLGIITVYGYVGATGNDHTFQYRGERTGSSNLYADWFYFQNNTRNIGAADVTLKRISFSIAIAEINDSYAYVENTGQILFAGRNTPYYGYTNIHDMPTGT